VGLSVASGPVPNRNGEQLSAPEFLNLYTPVKYGHTWTFQGRGRKFFSAPSTWLSNPPFEKSFFFVSGLGWELPSILWDHPPEARVPLKWGDPMPKRVFPKPRLTATQRDRLDRMIAWSVAHIEAGSEESNLGFLLRPVNLQKYLGFSAQRCAGMANIPHPLFPSKKKGKVEGSTRRTRSKGPSPAPVKEIEPSASSDMGSASLSSSEEGDSAGHPAPQIVEGPVILDDSSDEDEDEVPLARRTPALKRKAVGSPRCADPSPFPIEEEAESHEYVEFIRTYRPMKRAKGVNILLEGEDSEPPTGAVPQAGVGEVGTAPPSLPSSVSETEPATEEARIESVAPLEGRETEAIATEVVPMPENEDIAAVVDQQETEPIVGDNTTVVEIASFEVQGPQAVPVGSGSLDSRALSREEVEPC
jgi:hypothetical protein